MEVDKEILSVWRNFTVNGQYEGELMNLVRKSGFRYTTVSKAISTGKCTPKVHDAINRAASDIILEIRESAQKLKDILHAPIS